MCASTELELDRWLAALGPEPHLDTSGLAVVSRRQRYGRGQWQRHWISPAGGLWLSAAFCWPAAATGSAAPLTLALAVGLALELEQLGLAARIKWPNDLLLDGRKLAGMLARLRLKGGQVRWARAGIGLNGTNRAPAGAISLAEALQAGCGSRFHPQATAKALLPRVLRAISWAQAHSEQGALVLSLAEQRLLRPPGGWLHQGQSWQVLGLAAGGGLLLQRGDRQTLLAGPAELSPESHA